MLALFVEDVDAVDVLFLRRVEEVGLNRLVEGGGCGGGGGGLLL